MSWGWRKLLQLHDLVRPYIWTKIGNGKLASAWEGFNKENKVADLGSNIGWVWPHDWLRKAPNIGLIQVPNLDDDSVDSHYWREENGNINAFFVKYAWEAFRPRNKLRHWDIGSNLLSCPFCEVQPDTHSHLFFECNFPSQPLAKKRMARSVVGKLIVAATSSTFGSSETIGCSKMSKGLRKSLGTSLWLRFA
ncbi:hypothetical protein Tco_1467388 [Tanacetum coccineum]